MQTPRIERRSFLTATAAGIAGLTLGTNRLPGSSGNAETVRCGFVGVGGRGTALLKATLQVDNVDVLAICDTDAGNRDRACEAVEKSTGERPDPVAEWKKLLARSDLTAVISALPCDLHYPMYGFPFASAAATGCSSRRCTTSTCSRGRWVSCL